MPRALRLLIVLCLGCGSRAGSTASPTHPENSAPSARTPSETLPRTAVYADLVRSAGELENSPRAPTSCLLLQTPSAYQLRAELSLAVRPLPQPPDDLDEPLKNAAHVELLSAWGRHGNGNGKLALSAFTSSAPSSTAFALVLTDHGISLRSASGSTVAPADNLDLPSALTMLATIDPERSASVFLAAEASLPLAQVYRVLEGLEEEARQVVLAVTLAPNTPLPLPVSATAKAARCPDGLSATEAPEGQLERAQLLAGVAQLKEHAADCLQRGDAHGAAGGHLTIAFRIAQSGRVQEACITQDDLDDPGVSGCVIGIAGQLIFAPPAPTGVIDIELPIALQASPIAVQRPICGAPTH